MADFTNEIETATAQRDAAIAALAVFEAAKEYDPLVAQLKQLKQDKVDYEAEAEAAKKHTYDTKTELNKQLAEFRKQVDDETKELYAKLDTRKLEVESAVAKLDRQEKDAEDRFDGIIAGFEGKLAQVKKQIADAELLRDQLKGV